MQFEVPRNNPPLSEKDKLLVHSSLEIYGDVLYFHRFPEPTASTIAYSSQYIIEQRTTHSISRLILDFTDRQMVTPELRRHMLNHMVKTLVNMTDVAIVFDGNAFRRVVVDFFVRAYLRSRKVNVSFHETKEDALKHMGCL